MGIGGGAIINLVEIIISDLVPLAERGVFQGIIGLTWALACGVGPPLGGVLAGANWRWLFCKRHSQSMSFELLRNIGRLEPPPFWHRICACMDLSQGSHTRRFNTGEIDADRLGVSR